jgi:Ca2+-binding RTX toxin-like protein
MKTRAPIALIALALILPGAAQAATAGQSFHDSDSLVYAAGPGEQNRLTISHVGGQIVFEDGGAAITPGDSCTALTESRVACEDTTFVSVDLEDGDDEAATAGAAPDPDAFIFFDGDSGNDTLRSGEWPVVLNGGVGTDVLVGGPLTPSIDAVDTYAAGDFERLPRHDALRDEVTCAPPLAGKGGTDVSIETLDVVSGPCAGRYTYLDTHVDVRGTDGPDNLGGGRGPSRIHALGGNDTLFVSRNDRAYGGDGNDNLSGAGVQFGGAGDDRFDGNSSARESNRVSGGDGADAIFGTGGANRISGGAGRDRVSGRGGRDTIDVRDGERDTVRCGAGRDSVRADRRDVVARDCERRSVSVSSASGGSGAVRAAARSPRCRIASAKGSRIVARSSTALVYKRGFYAYSCLRSNGLLRRLPLEGGGYHTFRLAGRYVAYATFGSGIGDEFDRLYVYDMRAGVTVLIESSTSIRDIVVKPNASAAWVEQSTVRPTDFDTPVYDVRKVSFVERQGSVLLDRGADVGPRSLALAEGDTAITWTRGGQPRTAPLP